MRPVNSDAVPTDNGDEREDPVENGSDVNIRRFELVNLHNNHRRRPQFCHDVWVESVEFLELKDLCRANAINRRVLGMVCQEILDIRKPPRKVPALTIDHRGINRAGRTNGRGGMEVLPVPEVAPPRDQILGFGSVTFKLKWIFSNDSTHQVLEGASKFLNVTQELLKEHDLLLDRFQCSQFFVEEKLAQSVFSQLPKVRTIEAEILSMGHSVLLESATFRGSKRLRFNNYEKSGLELGEEEFGNCVEWLHWPTGNGAPRTLIFCSYVPINAGRFLDIFVPMIIERFTDPACEPGFDPSPKFTVLALFRWEQCQPEPFRLEGFDELGDALWLEPITDGCDRFGRPLREIVELVDGMQDRGNAPPGPDHYLQSLVPGALIGERGGPPPQELYGFILRRDVAVGPYARPELFEAQRPQIIHFEGNKP